MRISVKNAAQKHNIPFNPHGVLGSVIIRKGKNHHCDESFLSDTVGE